jgi:hypothetical protein
MTAVSPVRHQLSSGSPGELGDGRVVALPVAEEEHRVEVAVAVAAMQGDIARRAARALAAVVVDHGDTVPGYGRPMLPARAGQRAAQLPTM